MTERYFQSDDPQDTPQPKRRSSGLLYLLLLVAGAVLIVAMMRGGSTRQRAMGEAHPAVGKAIERLELQPLTGDAPPINLASLEGKVTVLNFWGTWCPPCQEEFPHIVALAKEFSDRSDFQLAAVSCEPGVEKDIDALRTTTAQYLEGAKASDMPTYYDPQAVSRVAIMNTSGQFAFPTTLVLGRDGKIAGYWQGYVPGVENDIRALVTKLLKKA